MAGEIYRYRFGDDVAWPSVEDTILLAVLAAESIHGQAEVRLHKSYCLDQKTHTCVINADTAVGRTIARVATGLFSREFGDDAFTVDRVERSPGEGASP